MQNMIYLFILHFSSGQVDCTSVKKHTPVKAKAVVQLIYSSKSQKAQALKCAQSKSQT